MKPSRPEAEPSPAQPNQPTINNLHFHLHLHLHLHLHGIRNTGG